MVYSRILGRLGSKVSRIFSTRPRVALGAGAGGYGAGSLFGGDGGEQGGVFGAINDISGVATLAIGAYLLLVIINLATD